MFKGGNCLSTKKLFYKSIIWQVIGFIWISILSFIWFGSWINSLSFSLVVVVVSIFIYVIYEKLWYRLIKK
ncbi:MAG: hypothetical protein CMI90_06790 [Pelagibacteraceae bacterium]|nr:hypothetical protein [Pelagibacteraceae bacterium]